MVETKEKKKRLRVSTLKTEQDCVAEMSKLYKMARHGDLKTADLTRYVQTITQIHNALTIGRYGAESGEIRETIERAKIENVRQRGEVRKRVQ